MHKYHYLMQAHHAQSLFKNQHISPSHAEGSWATSQIIIYFVFLILRSRFRYSISSVTLRIKFHLASCNHKRTMFILLTLSLKEHNIDKN